MSGRESEEQKQGRDAGGAKEENGSFRDSESKEERDNKTRASRAAKAAAAAKAKAAHAKKRPVRKKEPEEPPKPSPKQPVLDEMLKVIGSELGPDVVKEAFINRPSRHLPTLVVESGRWLELARLLSDDSRLSFDYLRNLSGVDYETHLEVVVHLTSLDHHRELSVRVQVDRDQSEVPSVSGIWAAANWNEREVYDLLGIQFTDHPNLRRILMPDDWVGHPLRKDYEPYDKGV
ncbi:NADH-quinone oxidoreductase subunit C [Desmospora profundinema]|uniref:NADH-quinone oxidoreductase subunit C n=1 Tax=Desmospora profundinema TaxID=1571184 RepID=A0ABU1IL64_9BACL|nr:NADH-quinone oxidoreductase subunit C [Desmospora profundinema]MDR6225522.1 NADH-quinone oxidoreductase subunit C [Desmospora profundinema]